MNEAFEAMDDALFDAFGVAATVARGVDAPVSVTVVPLATTLAQSFSNSYTLAPTVSGAGRYFAGSRVYASGGASENTTSSWTTARNVSGLLVEIKAA